MKDIWNFDKEEAEKTRERELQEQSKEEQSKEAEDTTSTGPTLFGTSEVKATGSTDENKIKPSSSETTNSSDNIPLTHHRAE